MDRPERPDRKVGAGAAGGALGSVLVLGAVWLGVDQPPAGLEGALATLLGFLAGYFIPERPSE